MKKVLVALFVLAALSLFAVQINYGIFADLTTTNIWNLLGSGSSSWNFAVQLWKYPSLLGMNKEGQLIPSAAAEIPKIVKEGNMYTVTVKLRKDMRWSNGAPFTADDVVFTYSTVKEMEIPGGNWGGAYEPEKVEKIDQWTVKFYFKEKKTMTIYYDTLMTAIVCSNYWKPIVDKAKKQKDPVRWLLSQEVIDPGITALNLGKVEKGAFVQVVKQIANDKYWSYGEKNIYYKNGGFSIVNPKTGFKWSTDNPKPAGDVALEVVNGPFVDTIVYKIYGNKQVAIQALIAGDIDYIFNPVGLTAGEAEQLKGQKDIKVVSNPQLGFRYLAFNMRKFPMNVKEFRQAIAALIDRDFICNQVLQGRAIPLATPVPPANSFWYNSAVKTIGEGLSMGERYQLAVSLLKKAGFKWDTEPVIDPKDTKNPIKTPGKGLKGPDGKAVPTVTLMSPGMDYDPMRAQTAMYIEQWAKNIGIPLNLKLTDFNEIVTKAFDDVDFDMYMLGWGIGRVPTYFKSFWHSSEMAPEGFNTPGYNNPEFDALVEEFEYADTFEQARKAIFEAQRLLAEDLPYIILFTNPMIEAYRTSIKFPFDNMLDGIQGYYGFPEGVRKVQ
ncbi:ABC transporter substrate-binding protein [Fervidobacterium gondwanense]|uniref:ABC-type transport system, substrate-binding protein n=1 Tax=Fervidobacterium gondwanense DSM 13020 TaxID=1121883 RepID=A0A1M7T9A5_FERGO|nr:ABC transporter substrate-binding protein [Fervidobacterium gondwanense]SHN67272.1 ABC-type transport system, substrate-binding protein [Fervidobacterium gondwanense DSM 13020]